MLIDGLLSAEVEVEIAPSAVCTVDPAAASPARRIGVRVVVAVVGGRHNVANVGVNERGFEFVYCLNRSAMLFVMEVVVVSVYILLVVVLGAVGIVHWSRVRWCQGVARFRLGNYRRGFRYDG